MNSSHHKGSGDADGIELIRKVLFTSGALLSRKQLAWSVIFSAPAVYTHKFTSHTYIYLSSTYIVAIILKHCQLRNMAQAPQVQGYEHADAWDTNWLRVDETHELYYEQYGKQDGKAGKYRRTTYIYTH